MSIPAKMKAVFINEYGNASKLAYESIDTPQAAANEVLVKVRASGVNPVDYKIREGYLESMLGHSLPLTLGWDVSGEIVSVGSDVNGWKVGDEIYSRPDISRNGSYAEYMTVVADEIALKPASLTWEEAAAVPLTALTAWQVLDTFEIKEGDKILIQAGSGGVGHFAIQLAKLRGAHVLASCSTKNVEFVKSLGADEVVDYTQQDFSELRDLNAVFDTLGGEALEKTWQTLKSGGAVTSIVEPPSEDLAAEHDVKCHFVFVQPSSAQLDQLRELLDSKTIKVEVDKVFNLDEVAKAHEYVETNRARGKVVISV